MVLISTRKEGILFMKEKYWKELLDIFVEHEEFKKDHRELYETICLIVNGIVFIIENIFPSLLMFVVQKVFVKILSINTENIAIA